MKQTIECDQMPKNTSLRLGAERSEKAKKTVKGVLIGTQSGELIVGMVVLIGIAAFSLIQWMTQVHELRQDRIAPPGAHVVAKR